ncbi:MAG: response regulator [Candidatus Krumholzibacteriaceae bacterium]|jgi:two-component system alkaline phosphatase synthesis response regulator PhoP
MAPKILIADDEVHLVKILQLTLERAGYETIAAYDGGEALKKAREEHPGLVILDLKLPVLDGYKVCRMLKSDELTKSIPVIILSARDLARAEIDQSIAADFFMEKPFNSTALLDRISSLLA